MAITNPAKRPKGRLNETIRFVLFRLGMATAIALTWSILLVFDGRYWPLIFVAIGLFVGGSSAIPGQNHLRIGRMILLLLGLIFVMVGLLLPGGEKLIRTAPILMVSFVAFAAASHRRSSAIS